MQQMMYYCHTDKQLWFTISSPTQPTPSALIVASLLTKPLKCNIGDNESIKCTHYTAVKHQYLFLEQINRLFMVIKANFIAALEIITNLVWRDIWILICIIMIFLVHTVHCKWWQDLNLWNMWVFDVQFFFEKYHLHSSNYLNFLLFICMVYR